MVDIFEEKHKKIYSKFDKIINDGDYEQLRAYLKELLDIKDKDILKVSLVSIKPLKRAYMYKRLNEYETIKPVVEKIELELSKLSKTGIF